jgi:hypothetical protein
MGEADLFRQYAKEAMHLASEVANENEKRTLVDVAYTWALAGLMSDRVLGSSFVSSLAALAEPHPTLVLIGPLRTPNFSVESGAGKQRDEAARRM